MIFHLTPKFFKKLRSYYFPIVYTLFFIGFFIFPSGKSHNNFFYLAIAFPFASMILFKKVTLKIFFLNRIFMLSALFLIYMVITLFWSKQSGFWEIFQYGRHVAYILLFICISMHLIHNDPNFLNHLLTIFCFTAALVSVIYSIYYYLHNPFPQTRLVGYGRLYNPIGAASLYGVSFIGCLYFLFQKISNKARLIYLFMITPIFSYILLAQSRGPFLALVFSLLGWAAINLLTGKNQLKFSRISCLILLNLLVVGTAFSLIFPEFFKNFFTERGLSYRVEIWGIFFEKINSALLMGHGLGMDTRILTSDGTLFLHPHSVYVATLFYGGIIGLLLLFVLIGYTLFQATKIKEPHHRFLLVSTVIFGALCIATDGSTLLQHPKPFWIYFWFPVAMAAATELRAKINVEKFYFRRKGKESVQDIG